MQQFYDQLLEYVLILYTLGDILLYKEERTYNPFLLELNVHLVDFELHTNLGKAQLMFLRQLNPYSHIGY